MEFIIGEHTRKCPRCHDEEHELFEALFIEPNGTKHTLKVCYSCGARYVVGKLVTGVEMTPHLETVLKQQ